MATQKTAYVTGLWIRIQVGHRLSKTDFVKGGASGIGRAVVEMLTSRGYAPITPNRHPMLIDLTACE